MSGSIFADRGAYYEAINRASRTLDATAWIGYFARLLTTVAGLFSEHLLFVARRNAFLAAHEANWNARQAKAIRRMLAEGPDGFKGGMTPRKHCSITGTSRATATRDLTSLPPRHPFPHRLQPRRPPHPPPRPLTRHSTPSASLPSRRLPKTRFHSLENHTLSPADEQEEAQEKTCPIFFSFSAPRFHSIVARRSPFTARSVAKSTKKPDAEYAPGKSFDCGI